MTLDRSGPFTRGAVALAFATGTLALAPDDTTTYGYAFTPPQPADGKAEILKIELNSADLRAGGPIAIRVTTARDVVDVVTGHGKHEGSLHRIGVGVFESQSTLPHVGGFVHVRIKLHFKATTADGRVVEVDVPVRYK